MIDETTEHEASTEVGQSELTAIVRRKIDGLAKLATSKVIKAGGKISFDDYDESMKDEIHFPPLNWIAGWGLPSVQGM